MLAIPAAGLSPMGHAEVAEHRGDVVLDRPLRDEQLGGDLGVPEPVGEEAERPRSQVGCGWAFRSAEWLADATAPALRDGTSLRRALHRYRKAYRFLRRHDDLGGNDARALPPNKVEQLVARAALTDPEIARRMRLFGMGAAPPSVLMNPRVLVRAWRVARRAGVGIGVESVPAAVGTPAGPSSTTESIQPSGCIGRGSIRRVPTPRCFPGKPGPPPSGHRRWLARGGSARAVTESTAPIGSWGSDHCDECWNG